MLWMRDMGIWEGSKENAGSSGRVDLEENDKNKLGGKEKNIIFQYVGSLC